LLDLFNTSGIWQRVEQYRQVSLRVVAIRPRGLDETEDPATRFGAGNGIGKQEVLARDCNRLGDMLGADIRNRNTAIVAVLL